MLTHGNLLANLEQVARVEPAMIHGDDVVLGVLDVCGAPAWMARLARPGMNVAVIGAGPIGLSAALQLVTKGETPLILESGDHVGASIREWAHVRLFSELLLKSEY